MVASRSLRSQSDAALSTKRATADEVVFTDLGLALFETRAGAKRLWVDQPSGHDDLAYDAGDPKWREVLRFVLSGVM
jgi:hypothetical protein